MKLLIFILVFVLLFLWVIISGRMYDAKEQKNIYEKALQPVKRRLDRVYLCRDLNKETVGQYLERHKSGQIIDDVTWKDLGMDQVFNSIDLTSCTIGREYLYHTLRSINTNNDDLQRLEDKIGTVSDREHRAKLIMSLQKLGNGYGQSIYQYLDHLKNNDNTSNTWHYFMLFLYVPAFVLFMVDWTVALFLLVALLCVSIITYFRYKTNYGQSLKGLILVSNMLKVAAEVGIDSPQALRLDAQGVINVLCGGGIGRNTGNPLSILMDYVRMLTHLDIIVLNRNITKIRKNYDNIDSIVSELGYLDLAISISRLREALEKEKGYCIPDFTGTGFHGEGLYHPVLTDPVTNSIHADREIIITGSNASGKTTFLKTVAVNAIMARTLNTCMGKSLSVEFCNICSSLSPADDLIQGTSYYVAEVNSLKRIFDISGQERVLCFIDEVLRGTNTVERIAASSEILKALSDRHYLCFAATHDGELCDLLDDRADNYHFEEEYVDGSICFSYKIRPGKNEKRNAIRLLEKAGFPSALTESSEKMVEEYIESKKWVLK